MKILYKSNDGKIFTVSDNCTDLIDLPKGIYDDIGTIIDFLPVEDNETVIEVKLDISYSRTDNFNLFLNLWLHPPNPAVCYVLAFSQTYFLSTLSFQDRH